CLRPRQQHLRLDVNQRRGHDEKFAGDVQIQLLHQRDRCEVLRGDERDRDVVDVDLVLPDQVQEQIKRSLEVGQLNGEGIGRRFEIVSLIHQNAKMIAESVVKVSGI